uniref:Uncharacterized protein n=1 Tax=Daphnia galeata TaxID=27404 RepID=A0A8J2W7S4_9CRUS|nr:unnamed protein product [Daphnia galeata]
MDGREMIHWILMMGLSILAVQAFDNNRPVDHQRKILVRMVWPGGHTAPPPSTDDTTPIPVVIPAASFSRQMIIRFPSSGSISSTEKKLSQQAISSDGYDPSTTEESADYSLDSYVSLSLSSGGSDAEGADQNLHRSRNEKSYDGNNSKLDLLQQLLRLAPSAVENGNDDKCNHPFHSWICNNNKEIARSTTTPQPTTTIRQQTEYFPISSFENVQILIPDLTPTIVPPLPAPPVQERLEAVDSWKGMDPCNHPFHSWMCAKPKVIRPPPEFKETGASVLDENLLLPSIESTTTTTPAPTLPPTTKRSSWDGADPCTHPFHSWLCGKQLPAVRTKTSPPPTTTPQPLIPDASFFIPDLNPAPLPTTTQPPPPPTTTIPLIIRTLAPKKGWDEADSCSHPFHSWLCEKPKVKTTPPTTTVPPTTTTPLPPPPEEAVIFEPAPSIDEGNQLVPDVSPPPPATTAKPTKSSGWDEADSCSHPFHSWLCAKPQAKMRTTRPPPTTTTPLPAADIQLPEAASNFETQDAIPLILTPEITTYRPAIKIIPTQSSGWAEGADPCSHPFHSWLCAKPQAKARTTRPPPPTTTLTPPAADIQLPDASNFGPQEAIPIPIPVVITTPPPVVIPASGWAEDADPCTHPFHSWLCNRSQSAKQNLKLDSNLRIGRQSIRSFQSEREALEEETAESSRWNKFESLRLLPSGVRQRK